MNNKKEFRVTRHWYTIQKVSVDPVTFPYDEATEEEPANLYFYEEDDYEVEEVV